jgi:hypothetical protein
MLTVTMQIVLAGSPDSWSRSYRQIAALSVWDAMNDSARSFAFWSVSAMFALYPVRLAAAGGFGKEKHVSRAINRTAQSFRYSTPRLGWYQSHPHVYKFSIQFQRTALGNSAKMSFHQSLVRVALTNCLYCLIEKHSRIS